MLKDSMNYLLRDYIFLENIGYFDALPSFSFFPFILGYTENILNFY